ncbi:cobalt-zinc-cadmium resistance protein [Escherichia phage vB-Eco-KMB41]|nr:cobalt-zinc-cadmium resistance protein [Escherichia phage vB-Eco-KMB41]
MMHDEEQQEPTREELLDQILPGEARLEPVPEWLNAAPEPTEADMDQQMAIAADQAAEQGLSLAEMELYAFGDNEDDHQWDLVLDENQKPVAKPRSETTEDQREKDKKAIAELLADQPDEFLDKLRAGNKITPVNYVIQSLVPERSVGFLVGESGAKKTFCALQMAICVATGIDFAGLPVRQGSVLYFAPEDASGVRERYAGWKYKRNGNKDLNNLFIIGEQVPLHNAEILQRFAGKVLSSPFFGIEENAPALVVIDTYSANSAGQKVGQTAKRDADGKVIEWVGGQDFNENDNNVAAILMANAAKLAEMLNCAVMVIHHTGKDTERGARGASTLRANAGFEIMVKKCKDKELFVIEHTKAKGCALLPPRAMRTQSVPLPPELVKMKREAMARMKPVRPEAQQNPAAWEIGDNLGTLVVINALEAVPTGDKEEKADEGPKRSQQEENAIRLVNFVHEYNSKRRGRTPKLTKAALSEWARNSADPQIDKTAFRRAFLHATNTMGIIKVAGDETLTATKEAAPLLGGIRDQKPLPTDWKPSSKAEDQDDDLNDF